MNVYINLNGHIIGAKKLTVDDLLKLARSVDFLKDIRLFIVNIVENKYLLIDKEEEIDFISLFLMLLFFFNVNEINAYIKLPDTPQPDKIQLSTITISIPQNDNKTFKFTYKQFVKEQFLQHFVAETFLVSSENLQFLLSNFVHPEYCIKYKDYNITYELPTFLKNAMLSLHKALVDYTKQDNLKQLYQFAFYYSMKSKQTVDFSKIYPEDIPILQDILQKHIQQEQKEYQKLEQETKKVRNR